MKSVDRISGTDKIEMNFGEIKLELLGNEMNRKKPIWRCDLYVLLSK